jgi:hypothetical protein
MPILLPILVASAMLTTVSAAPPLGNSVNQITVVLEPATNILLICGLITVGGLAIFLGKKIG